MAHLTVTHRFDYRWPSGCVTAFKPLTDADGNPIVFTVKKEILEYAIAHKVGKDADDKPATPKSKVPSERAIGIAEHNEVTGVGPTDPAVIDG